MMLPILTDVYSEKMIEVILDSYFVLYPTEVLLGRVKVNIA